MTDGEFRPLLIEVAFQVKTYDVDYAQIMHNAVYIRWLEDLRLQIMSDHFPLEELLADHISPVLEKTEITYHRPLRLLDRATGRMWVSNLSKVRWEVQAEISRGDMIASSAKQTGYFIDLERYRPIRIPSILRDKWDAANAAKYVQSDLYTTLNRSQTNGMDGETVRSIA